MVARRRGLRIAEVPVTWRNDVATRVGLAKGARAFADLAANPLVDGLGRGPDAIDAARAPSRGLREKRGGSRRRPAAP